MTRLVLFTRFARVGLAKTRLAKDLGAVRAAQLQRQMTQRIQRQAWRAGFSALDLLWADLPAHMRGRRQVLGDLGGRMAKGLQGPGPILLMGTDLPLVDKQDLQVLRLALQSHPYVMAPATDGGFWAIGLRSAGLFPRLTNALQAHLDGAGMVQALGPNRLFLGPTRDDCDDVNDYLRLGLAGGLRG